MIMSNDMTHNKIKIYSRYNNYDFYNKADNIGIESVDEKVDKGLDFILKHLPNQQPSFPRHIMTYTLGYQHEVFRREEAIQYFKDSNYLDCRIRAYPSSPPTSNFLSINTIPPTTIKIDLDRFTFPSDNSHRMALTKTVANIKQNLGTHPTVIWSGNGYHVLQPIDTPTALENIEDFSDIGVQQPSVKFIRFAEWYLSNGKSDSSHNHSISFGNCLLRIPGSHNSKCVSKNNGVTDSSTEVKVLQEWDGYRPKIGLLIGSFYAYIVDQREKNLERQEHRKGYHSLHSEANNNFTIPWIEKLLQTPIPDHRKFAIWRILSPYLLNVKKLSKEEASYIIKNWLNRCNEINRLDFNAKQKIREGLNGAKEYYPINLNKLKTECRSLYDTINNHG
ncbi:hypothetical protein BH18THE2_BH18THE2_27640 [soil metagenome]